MKHHSLSLIILSAALLQAAQAYAGNPEIDYVLTTQNDPIKPGHVLEFDATVRNLSGSLQNVRLDFLVPDYTTYAGYPPRTPLHVSVVNLPSGASYTFKLLFSVDGGNHAPDDGTPIELTLTDKGRGAPPFSRSAVVQRTPPLNLQLSTEQGTVAPGETFTYTLSCSNISAAARNGVTSSASVPEGATFVSADGGGQLNGGTVDWNLVTLPVGANRQLHVTFQATGNTSLAEVNATLSDGSGNIARASDTRAVYDAPEIQYIITAPTDPAKPGHVLEFDATVRNLSGSLQNVRLDFTVPEFTTYAGYPPGTPVHVSVVNLPSGASHTFQLLFNVAGGNTAPPDGTTIGLNLIDTGRGGSVSRGVVVRAMPPINLQLSTQQGTVAPGGDFTYTLTCANVSATARNVALIALVPAGASFVSADGGGQLINGVVIWTSLGTLTAGDDTQLHATFRASAIANTPLGPVNATLFDYSGNVARASDWRAVYDPPEIEYTITPPPGRVEPGDVARFDATVHNLSGSLQNVRLDFTVPEFTTYNGYPPGTPVHVSVVNLPSDASYTFQLLFNVAGGNMAPPPGTVMTLNLIDLARAGSVSHTIEIGLVSHPKTDFNADTFPDFLLYYVGTRQTAIWYLNNNVLIGAAYAPTLPAGWTLRDVADFNRDGHSDYALFNATTRQTAIWYLNNNVYISGAYGPTLPGGWELSATDDFNGDGRPDYVLHNASTRQTAIWYMNNNIYVSGAYGPTLPAGWSLVGIADFNSDGKSDYLLFNTNTRQTAIWYLNNNVYVSGAYGPTVAVGYALTGAADFNTDGKPDYLLYSASTRRTAIWYMNNNVYVGAAYAPTLPAGWSLVAP